MQNKTKQDEKKIQAIWSEISARAWTDEDFKNQLLANPQKILKEYGLDTEDLQYQVVENTESSTYLVLPEKPKGNLSEEELKQIATAGSQALLWKC